ncbi:MAG: hypothetical protein ABEL76_15630, partial [Bradymonadaceae bacterium]
MPTAPHISRASPALATMLVALSLVAGCARGETPPAGRDATGGGRDAAPADVEGGDDAGLDAAPSCVDGSTRTCGRGIGICQKGTQR